MSFRGRLTAAFLALAIIPLAALGLGIRGETTRRLTEQYDRRVNLLLSLVEDDWRRRGQDIASRLDMLARNLLEDTRFRLGLAPDAESDRRYLLDVGESAMRQAGLSVLQVQDTFGRIVTSGHFRNEFDRIDPTLPGPLRDGGVSLVRFRGAAEPILALASVDSVQLGSTTHYLVGGIEARESLLETLVRDPDVTVALEYPGGSMAAGHSVPRTETLVRQFTVPFVDAVDGRTATARVVVAHDTRELSALRRRMDLWLAAVVGSTVLLAILAAGVLARRISRPLATLAEKTARVDLDRLEIDFESDRRDEIGALARLLGTMTARLRHSAARLRDVERRAAVGELARQVNHDIKNGLTPIRNIIRHLSEVARDEPDQLARVFGEREGTLQTSIAYLEGLSANYARLYPRGATEAIEVNRIVRAVLDDAMRPESVEVALDLAEPSPRVRCDAVVMRRILENLIANALESMQGSGGALTVTTGLDRAEDGPHTRVVVADTGPGMTEEQMQRAFDSFYTTKERGTGLGLSIVRRLVLDVNGTLRAESAPGKGARFRLTFPAVGDGRP